MKTLQLIVEGQGDSYAFPVLVRRILHEKFSFFDFKIDTPIWKSRSQLLQKEGLEIAIKYAKQRKCDGIIVLIDADDLLPESEACRLFDMGKQIAGNLPFAYILAKREYEAWFLASLETLQGKCRIKNDACFAKDPESVRGAKEKLITFMPRHQPYSPTADQEDLTGRIDLDSVFKKCKSFRKLTKEIKKIMEFWCE
jgi:hypothetical protein